MKAILAALILTASAASTAMAEPAPPPPVTASALPDGGHDFDFEIGNWTAHISRRLRPLTGSTEWVHYEGSSVVHSLWSGRANIGELNVTGSSGSILGSSYRLYNPATKQWSVRWANSADGELTTPMIGGFVEGRGLFYDQEDLGGRSILVRFIFSPVKDGAFSIEQAFSPDGGATWETNWIARFRKVR